MDKTHVHHAKDQGLTPRMRYYGTFSLVLPQQGTYCSTRPSVQYTRTYFQGNSCKDISVHVNAKTSCKKYFACMFCTHWTH